MIGYDVATFCMLEIYTTLGLYDDASSVTLRITLDGETKDYPVDIEDSGKKSASLPNLFNKVTKKSGAKESTVGIGGLCIIRKYNYQDLTISIESEDFGNYELPLSVAMVDFDGSQYPCLVAESDDEVV